MINNYIKSVYEYYKVETKMIVKDVPLSFPSPSGCTGSITIAEPEVEEVSSSIGKQRVYV